jgi:alkylation response protein AidB-like acyl-CoA dehydrogenase
MVRAFPKDATGKRQHFMERLSAIRSHLEAVAEAAEEQATLPQSTVDLLYREGLLHLKLPEVLGGAELDPIAYLDVIEALSRIDSSAGWCALINCTSIAWPGAFLPDEAVEQIFAGGSVPIAAGAAGPLGKATPVEGGYLVTGRWPFGSGIRHAQWALGGCRIQGDREEPPGHLMVAVPVDQIKIYDNWQVMGLKGTGSCDFSISELFVPSSFTWDMEKSAPRRGGPHFLMGRPGFVIADHAAFILGVARRSLDEIIELSETKTQSYSDSPIIATSAAFHRDIGKADMQLQSVRALMLDVLEEAWDSCCRGVVPEPALQSRLRSAAVLTTDVGTEVAGLALRYGGGASIYSSVSLQRCFRDINAAAQHRVVRQSSYENHGQFLLGMTDVNPNG